MYSKGIAPKITLLLSLYLLKDSIEHNHMLLLNLTDDCCYTVHLFSLLKKKVPCMYELIYDFGERITDAYIEENKSDLVIHNDVITEPIKACPLFKTSHFSSKQEIE